eukprot:1302157-Rhodomonas_salina.1
MQTWTRLKFKVALTLPGYQCARTTTAKLISPTPPASVQAASCGADSGLGSLCAWEGWDH